MAQAIRAGLDADSDLKELRNFGLIVGGIVLAIFGVMRPIVHHATPAILPSVIGVALIVAGLLVPGILRHPYRLWERFGRILGAINSRIVLNLIFFLIFVPAATIARALGWDPLDRRFDRSRASYRKSSEKIPPRTMEKPY